MIVPNFEIKDSYILKNKINYDVSTGGEFSSATYGILYTDYDLARKTQKYNAENFSDIILSGISLSSYNSITINHYDKSYTLILDGYLQSEFLLNSTNFSNNTSYLKYTVNNSTLYNINDYLEILFYQKTTSSGTVYWENYELLGNVYYASGLTSNGNQWEITGLTSDISSTWTLDELIPIFKYNTYIIETGTTFIYTKKILEDYLINNLLTEYIDIYYNIINLNHCPNNIDDISIYLKKSIFGNYLDIKKVDSGITLSIGANKNIYDIYFDFDNLEIILNGITPIIYKFNTNNLYNKYTLERFLDQFYNGLSANNEIYINYSASTTSDGYNNEHEFNINLLNINDNLYFKKYTYINIYTNLSNVFKCVLIDISGTTLTILEPSLSIVENVIKIDNLYTVKDISDILYGCYINIDDYVNGYKTINIEIRRKIYESYYEIINDLDINRELRDKITGILFENSNNVYVLKIYNPQDIKDKRLSYSPVESTMLGKNKKTTVPFRVDSVRPIQFDVIDDNIYSDFVIDDNLAIDLVILWDPILTLSWDVNTTLYYGDSLPSASSNIDGIFKYNPTGLTVGVTSVIATFYPTNKLIYQDGDTISNTFTVYKSPLYVSGNTVTKIYGEENPDFYVIYSGFKNGENENISGFTKPIATCSATQYSNVGDYSIIPSGGVSSNYDFIYYNGKLTIQKAKPEILWNNPNPISTTTPLSSTQLNATVNPSLSGTFVYNPPLGTLLPKGTQTLNVTFIPLDSNWDTVQDSVNIVVVEI